MPSGDLQVKNVASSWSGWPFGVSHIGVSTSNGCSKVPVEKETLALVLVPALVLDADGIGLDDAEPEPEDAGAPPLHPATVTATPRTTSHLIGREWSLRHGDLAVPPVRLRVFDPTSSR